VERPRFSAGGRSQSDCTFPANVGSSLNMSYKKKVAKEIEYRSTTLENEFGAKTVKCRYT